MFLCVTVISSQLHRLWRDVTLNLKQKDIDAATEAKHRLEEKQRAEARERKEKEQQWETRVRLPTPKKAEQTLQSSCFQTTSESDSNRILSEI